MKNNLIKSTPSIRFPGFTTNLLKTNIGHQVDLVSGFAFKSEYFTNNGKKLITPKNFTKYGKAFFNKSNTKYTLEKPNNKYLCKSNDLLVLLTDLTPTCELLGKPLLINEEDGELLLNQRIVKLIPRNDIDLRYLFHYLLTERYHKVIKEKATGTTVKHSSNKVIESLQIKLPTLKEQQKIASFLSAVDAWIDNLKSQKAALKKYKKGMMQKIFPAKGKHGPEIRFKDEEGKEFPEWEEKRLGDVCSFIKDGTHGTHKDTTGGGFWLLSAKNIKNGKVHIDETDREISSDEFETIYSNYRLQTKDLLLSVVGTIGRVALFDGREDVAFQRSVAFFRLKEDSAEFFFQVFSASDFQMQLMKRQVISAQPGIYLGDLYKIPINLPFIQEQQKIAKFLTSLDNLIESKQQQLSKAEEWKKGLLQQMFV